MSFWTTDAVSERERFAYWREVICQSLFNISAEAPPGRFVGQMRVRTSGALRFLSSESSSYRYARSEQNISRAAANQITILMQARGNTEINHRDGSHVFQTNDIGIYDGVRPFSADNSDGSLRLVAVIPRVLLESRAPWLRQRPIHRLASNLKFLDLARRHMTTLVTDNLSEPATALLTENLCNLLALASATDIPTNRLQGELQLEAMLAFCRQNLHYPDLSPQHVAERFGVSVRTVHLRFEKLGKSFGQWLLEKRLDACGRVLTLVEGRPATISEIAYNWGFNDLSHFNKAFRRRFGMSPSEWRHQSKRRAE